MISPEGLREALIALANEASDNDTTLSVFRNPEDGIVVVVALQEDAPLLEAAVDEILKQQGRQKFKGRTLPGDGE